MQLSEVQDGGHAGKIAIGLSELYYKRLDELPGTLFSKKDNCYVIAKTYPSALLLGGAAREMGIKVVPSLSLATWVKQERADWLELTARSERVLAAEEHQEEGLFPHQSQDIRWLVFDGGPPGRILLNDTGTGKTRAVIRGMLAKDAYPALIICPRGVIKTGWAKELDKVAPQLRVGLADGNVTQRRKVFDKALAGELDVVVIGYEAMRSHTRFKGFPGIALKRCEKCGGAKLSDEGAVTPARCQAHAKELNAIPWKLVVADEGHRGLNPRSNTRMAMGGIAHSSPGALRWLLTATPVSKRTKADRIWSLLNWVDDDAWPVKGQWTDRYCLSGFNDGGFIEIKGYNPARLDELHASMNAITRRVLIDQAMDLPPILRGGSLIHTVTMGTEQARVYAEMRDEMLAKVKEGLITAASVPNLAGRLTMLASAVGIPGPDKSKMGVRLPSAKFDELVDMIENDELGDQWVMAFNSRQVERLFIAELLKKELFLPHQIGIIDGEAKQADRDQAIELFQAGKIPVIAFTHAAGGVGITLTAASTLVMAERPWADWQEKQSLGRVRRAGMPDRPVQVIDLITEGTVEYAQLERIGDDALVLEDIVQDQARMAAWLAGKTTQLPAVVPAQLLS